MRVPLEALDQDTQEQMLIALAGNDGEALEELIERHDSAPADSEELLRLLSPRHHIHAETQDAIAQITQRKTSRRKTEMEIEKAELEKCADAFGHGYRSKGAMVRGE